MQAEITPVFNMLYERLRERNTQAEVELEENLAAQRRKGIKEIQLKGNKLDTYLRHLENIYSRIITENNSFTRENVLEVYTPEGIVNMIDRTINCLGSEVENKNTGQLYIFNRFNLVDLPRVVNLRANSSQELERLLDDAEVYEAVSLGFVEVSPEQLKQAAKETKETKDYLTKYANSSTWNKFRNYYEANRHRETLDPKRTLFLDYLLTPLGRAAVIPINREAMVLAESSGFFENNA